MKTKIILIAVSFLFLFSSSLAPQGFITGSDIKINKKAVSAKVLLNEIVSYADNVIDTPPVQLNKYASKVKKLAALGFDTPQVRKVKKYDELIKNRSELIDKINSYSELFPKNPFITKEEVKRIAEKYNLYVGNIDRFVNADIPTKNVDEILEFDALYNKQCAGALDTAPATYHVMAQYDMFDVTRTRLDGPFIIEDKDPIVFAEIDGDYIIVTAWGDDAIEPMYEIEKWVKDVGYLYERREAELTGSADITWITVTDGSLLTWDTGTSTIAIDVTDITTDEIIIQ